jgi:glyoxylase-like metal-dependent hydrolase (beta-lactamase superfamily II)
VVSEAEHAFWTDDGILAQVPEGARIFFQLARAAIAPYARAGRLRRIAPGGEVAPGITSVEAYGHTPGHTMYRVVSDNEALLIRGDIVHVPALQFARPDWGITCDVDRAKAADARRRVLDAVASDRERVAGTHLGFPGFGHVNRTANGYAFAPVLWSA